MKRLCPNRGTVPARIWRDWGKPQTFQIHTRHLPNTGEALLLLLTSRHVLLVKTEHYSFTVLPRTLFHHGTAKHIIPSRYWQIQTLRRKTVQQYLSTKCLIFHTSRVSSSTVGKGYVLNLFWLSCSQLLRHAAFVSCVFVLSCVQCIAPLEGRGAAPYGLAQQCAPSCGSSQGKNKPCRRDWKITFYVQPGTAFWPLYIPCRKFDDGGFLDWYHAIS